MLGKSNSSLASSYLKIKNQDLVVTKNGTYTHMSGYTGLGKVVVDVLGGSEASLLNIVNNSNKNISNGDKVWINVDTSGLELKYSIVDFSDINEDSFSGIAMTNGNMGSVVSVLTIVSLPVLNTLTFATKSGENIVTKNKKYLIYKY